MNKFKVFIAAFAMVALLSSQAMAAITYSVNDMTEPYPVGGNSKQVVGYIDLAGTYATSGFTLTPASFGLSHIQSAIIQGEDGYQFWYNTATGKIFAFQTAAITPAGSITITPHADSAGAITVTGASYTPAGTITGQLELATPAFTGTGISAIGQVMTTTDNPVIGLNAAAGMWLYGATGTNGPVLVLSNTAGTGVAPVAFTVQGAAFTDAGAYTVVTMGAATFAGTPATISPTAAMAGTHSHASTAALTGTPTTAAPLAEVGAGVSLASVDKVNFVITGW